MRSLFMDEFYFIDLVLLLQQILKKLNFIKNVIKKFNIVIQ